MRRTLIVVASIIVIVGLAIGIYYLFFAPKPGTLVVATNPFEDTGSGNASASGSSLTEGQGAGTVVAPNFIKITDGPVSEGMAVVDVNIATPDAATTSSSTPTTPDTDVRFIDRSSGNIYSYVFHARTLTRRSNKTLPGIQEASWVPNGSMAYVRFITTNASDGEHVATYALPVDGESGYFLEQDLAEARVASSTGLFTLLTSTSGSVGTVAKTDGSNPRTLFTSFVSSLLVYPAGNTYFAHTKASSQTNGYGFQLIGASFSRILGPLRGLTLLPSPSGKSLLYSYVDGGAVHLAVINIASHTATALPLATLTEKCVWADEATVYCGVPTDMSTGNLPDDWYQGAVSFTDRIWRIDMNARVATLVVDPTQVAKTSIDAISLTVDPKEDVLVFMDKKTGSLWAYDL
ncbi:MAG: hypothetical protein JWL88_164 [Parcubacteria group bacterium]|nr:hypothetical protein [Parcubacteria group bacterium]